MYKTLRSVITQRVAHRRKTWRKKKIKKGFDFSKALLSATH